MLMWPNFAKHRLSARHVKRALANLSQHAMAERALSVADLKSGELGVHGNFLSLRSRIGLQ